MGSFRSSGDQRVGSGVWQALGRVPYRDALTIQETIAAERARGLRPDTLLLLEHPPTVTLGRRASANDLRRPEAELADDGIAVERVRRGGRATYHGPGQLVGYPIVRLPSGGRGVRRFVAALESTLIDAVAAFGVAVERHSGHPGAWIGDRKIASIGIEVRRGITRHGFALNVAMDLEPFSAIVPCGVPGLEMTDLSREAGTHIAEHEAMAAVLRAWRRHLGTIEEERLHVAQSVG
jgi:lipoate-protein ligase B